MTDWIPLPDLLFGEATSEPFLVSTGRTDAWVDFYRLHGAALSYVDVGKVRSAGEAVDSLRTVLSFPAWCGSSWDSIEDAFSELCAEWSFPILVVVRGLPELLASETRIGLELVIRLSSLCSAFSQIGKQLVVYSEARAE